MSDDRVLKNALEQYIKSGMKPAGDGSVFDNMIGCYKRISMALSDEPVSISFCPAMPTDLDRGAIVINGSKISFASLGFLKMIKDCDILECTLTDKFLVNLCIEFHNVSVPGTPKANVQHLNNSFAFAGYSDEQLLDAAFGFEDVGFRRVESAKDTVIGMINKVCGEQDSKVNEELFDKTVSGLACIDQLMDVTETEYIDAGIYDNGKITVDLKMPYMMWIYRESTEFRDVLRCADEVVFYSVHETDALFVRFVFRDVLVME